MNYFSCCKNLRNVINRFDYLQDDFHLQIKDNKSKRTLYQEMTNKIETNIKTSKELR